MKLLDRLLKNKKAKGAAGCPAGLKRTCRTCGCPVTNPYALRCPRCQSELPAMPACGTCDRCGAHKPPES